MSQLPYEILEAMIQCFGKSFHYKDRMAAFLANCEVPKTFVDKFMGSNLVLSIQKFRYRVEPLADSAVQLCYEYYARTRVGEQWR